MAFAPKETYFDCGDGTILGSFFEKEVGKYFEFSRNTDTIMEDWPHKVWVTTPVEGLDSGYRYARVLKTVVYIAVDEDENGPVIEKWDIKQHRLYERG